MAGYHNDQFFRLNSPTSGETSQFSRNGAVWQLLGADNPKFIYPDRTIRTDDHEGQRVSFLKRGYIRSLATYTGGGTELDIRKCQFQFNPSTLTQSVESAQSTLNFAQMDPGQYAVPRSTSVNFTFDLLFDRSMEMNNSHTDAPVDGVNPWQQGDPGQVGVLRDLAAFYGVIGQSIDPAQASYMEQALIESIRAEAAGITSETNVEDTNKAIANVPGFIQANAANSAFLLPTPVRVMFSTLYVVEGFVTNTTVTFTKFNSAMVPMQCALSVTMEAKYIGFATKNTFLQWSLQQQKDLIVQNEKAESDRIDAIYTAFASAAAVVEVGTYPINGYISSNLRSLGATIDPDALRYQVYGRLPYTAEKSQDKDPVFLLFEDSVEPLEVIMGAQVFVYGPFDDLSYFEGKSQDVISHMIRSQNPPAPEVFQGMLVIPGDGCRATTAKGWRDMVKECSSHKDGNAGTFKATGDYDDSKYYVWQVNVDMQVKSNGVAIQGIGEVYRVLPPGSETTVIKQQVSLRWPSAPSTLSVPRDNVMTNAPNVGTGSTVGQVTVS